MNDTTGRVQFNPRYRQLDSLRGLAALCVFFSHYLLIFKYQGSWVRLLEESPLGILVNGRAAVMFFFVLSGFVLSLPFINSDKPLNLFEFYLKRIFRIYPAYIIAILFAVLLKTYFYDKNGLSSFSDWVGHFWNWDWKISSYIEILKTLILIGPKFNGGFIDPVVWSLVAEMQMSLLLPFFIIIVSRSNVFFNSLFFLLTLGLIYNHAAGILSIFYLGLLLAKYKEFFVRLMSNTNRYMLIPIILLCIFAYNIGNEFNYPYQEHNQPFSFFWRDMLNAISCCLSIVVVISYNNISKFLQHRFFLFIGDISYSFYLLHLPILIMLCSHFSSNQFSYSLLFFVAIVITCTLSYLSYKFIEKPWQRYAKNITEKSRMFKSFNLR